MKKFYFLILLMCLAIGNAWAADGNGFEIFGKEPRVTSFATWNVSDFVSGATGTFSYDPSTKTLTFNNVSVSGIDKKVVYNKSVDGLTIVFKGECTFYSTDNILRYEMATILDGSASTKVEMHVFKKTIGDDKETFYSNNEYNTGTHDPYASLEIKNFPYLRLTAAGDYCISHTYGAVDIKNSHVLMESGKGTIHTNMYALGWYSLVRLTDCYYAGNYYWMTTDDCRDIATKTSDDKAEKVKKAIILRDSEYSGVRLNGEAVPTTDSRWNASTKTLTLDTSVNASSNFTYPAAIIVEKPGITIDGGNNKAATGKKYGMYVNASETTIKGITLTGSYSGLYTETGMNCTLGDDVNLWGVDYAIKGGNITICPSEGEMVTMQYRGECFEEQTVDVNSLKLVNCIISPRAITAGSTTFLNGTTPWDKDVCIVGFEGWETYPVYINGTQVNEWNKDNLTSLLGSSATGTLKYNPSTNTLTMNNLKAAPSSSDTTSPLIYSLNGVTLAVEGVNEITATTQSTHTIYSGKGLVITKGNNTQSKLTLNGNPKTRFIEALQVNIRNVSLYIDGKCQNAGIANQSDYYFGSISNSTVSIKCGTRPLEGGWTTSGVYGNPMNSDRVITINPSTHELVYFYDNATSPSSDVVTEDIAIYPTGPYTMTVNGSKPQSYTSSNGVCFDEFSRRLYLRNTNVNGNIYITNISPTIYTIGDCSVTSSECPFKANNNTPTFTGPGTLNLTTTGNDYAAADFTGYGGVVVKNTTLNLKGGKYGMLYTNISQTSYPYVLQMAFLNVINSKVEAHCTPGNYVLFGFSMLAPSDCVLYIPQNGTYYNAASTGFLLNANGTVASDMLILPDTPDEIALDAHSDNDSFIFSNYGKEGIVTIKNLTIKGDGSWRTICLPFNVKRIGSVLQNCDIREYSSTLSRQQGDVEILDFTTSVLEMKANVPYIIRNMSGTDIVNPNFGFVKLEGSKQSVYMGISLGGSTSRYFAGSYAQRKETGVHVLEEGSMELSRKSV